MHVLRFTAWKWTERGGINTDDVTWETACALYTVLCSTLYNEYNTYSQDARHVGLSLSMSDISPAVHCRRRVSSQCPHFNSGITSSSQLSWNVMITPWTQHSHLLVHRYWHKDWVNINLREIITNSIFILCLTSHHAYTSIGVSHGTTRCLCDSCQSKAMICEQSSVTVRLQMWTIYTL